MGFLAFMKPKVDEKVAAAMSTVKDTTEDLHAAVDRLDRIVRNNIEQTVNRAFEENARLSGRDRRK